MTRTYYVALVVLIVLVICSTVLGRSFTAVSPGMGDAQLFAYIGEKWSEGYVPYVDVWDIKPPGIFLVTALASAFAPKSFALLAMIEGVFITGCIATVFLILRRLGAPSRAVFLGTAVCAVAANLQYYNQGGTLTEIYLLWPAALSMLAFFKSLPHLMPKHLLLAGFFAGIATSFKLVGLAPLLAQLTFLLLVCVFGQYGLRSVSCAAMTCLAGFLLAWLPWLIYFYWADGFLELIKASFIYPFLYGAASQKPVAVSALHLAERLHPIGAVAVAAFFGALLMSVRGYRVLAQASPSAFDWRKPERWLDGWALLTILWLLFDFLGAIAGGRYYPHYFLAMSASLSVMAAIAYWHIVERADEGGRQSETVSVFVLVLILGATFLAQVPDIRRLGDAVRQPRADHPLSSYLNTIHGRGDTLFVWPYKPSLLLQTGLKSPHKLTSAVNLKDFKHMGAVVGEELLAVLEKQSPTFIVDDERNFEALSRDYFYKRFRRLVEQKYELIRVEEGLYLYRLKSSS